MKASAKYIQNLSAKTIDAIKMSLGIEGDISEEEWEAWIQSHQIHTDLSDNKIVNGFTPAEQAVLDKIEELELLYGSTDITNQAKGVIDWKRLKEIAYTPCPAFHTCKAGPKYAINLLVEELNGYTREDYYNLDDLYAVALYLQDQLYVAESTIGQAGNIAFGSSSLLRASSAIADSFNTGTSVTRTITRSLNTNPTNIDETFRLSSPTQEMLDNPYHPDWARYDGPEKQSIGAGRVVELRSLEELLPDGAVPSVRGGKFTEWFDNLTYSELETLWENKDIRETIEDRIRSPGGLHEWCMVCRAPDFKAWDVSMEEIRRFRTRTEELKWTHPIDGKPGGHGGHGSGAFHNELKQIIDTSNSLEEFNKGIIELRDRWKIDPVLLPELPKKRT